MNRNTAIQLSRTDADALNLIGTKVAIIGGTAGIGRAISRTMASRGASVIVVGRTFRDADTPGVDFLRADLSLMSEARRVAKSLPAEHLDQVILTNGIFAAPKRAETTEGIQRGLAVSYLSRLVLLEEVAPRLGKDRLRAATKPRIFIWGFPGAGQKTKIEDLNFAQSFSTMSEHMTTVASNGALALSFAKRYPDVDVFGVNSGILKTKIRDHMLGGNSIQHRAMDWVVGPVTPSPKTYAKHMVPLLVSLDIENHSGAMFNGKGQATRASAAMPDEYVDALISA